MPSVIMFLFTDKINQPSILYLFHHSGYLEHKICAILSKNQNKLTLHSGSTYFQFASIYFGFELIRELTVIGGWFMTIKQINIRAITNKKTFHSGMCHSPSPLFF